MNPMKTAHELARREMITKAGMAFYGTYRKCFADQLRAVYASLRFPVMTGFVSVGATNWD